MSTEEQRLKEAFDAVTLPASVREDTLRVLSEKRKVLSETSTMARKGRRQPAVLRRRSVFALAACLMLAVMGLGGYGFYATETALVEIELNPSLELGVNRFDIVVAARAHNEDGAAVLEALSLVGRNYEEALTLLTESAVFNSFANDASFIDISVISNDDQQASNLVGSSETCIDRLPYEGRCGRASEQERRGAAQAGMGMSRYRAAQILMELDSTVRLEDCQSMSMRELRQRISELDPSNVLAQRNGRHGEAF